MSYRAVSVWHGRALVGQMWELRTRVMGMLGALGKMNLTSSNLLRRRQFSARKILQNVNICARKQTTRRVPSCPAISEAMRNDDGGRVALQRRNGQELRHADSRGDRMNED
jgi:hypothetical protein